jgi:hypothetical protein
MTLFDLDAEVIGQRVEIELSSAGLPAAQVVPYRDPDCACDIRGRRAQFPGSAS